MSATTLEGALTSYILANTASGGVVSFIAGRLHPTTDPQYIALPKITYQRINTQRSSYIGAYTNDGPTTMALATIQFDVWSNSLLTAKQTAAALRELLNGYSGILEGIIINSMQVVQEREIDAALYPGTEKPIQRVMLLVKVIYTD